LTREQLHEIETLLGRSAARKRHRRAARHGRNAQGGRQNLRGQPSSDDDLPNS